MFWRIKGNFSFESVKITKNLLLILLSGLVGTTVATLFLGIDPVFKDFMFIPQIVKYILIILLVSSSPISAKNLQSITNYFFFLGIILAMINIFQYWNFLGINNWLTPFYFVETVDIDDEFSTIAKMQSAVRDFRVVGTLGNPNYVGPLILLIFGFISVNILLNPNTNTHLLKQFYLIAPVIVFGLLLLQSRSTFIALFVLIFLTTRENNRLKIIKYYSFLIIFFGSLFFFSDFGNSMIERGFGERLSLQSESSQTSFDARLRDLISPFMYVLENPVIIPFGQGTSKSVLRTDSHNGFTWFLIRFGVIGLILYITIFISALKKIKKSKIMDQNPAIYEGMRFLIFIWIIVESTGNAFKEVKLFSLFLVILGIYSSCVISNIKSKN
jgi:hypothetical protein